MCLQCFTFYLQLRTHILKTTSSFEIVISHHASYTQSWWSYSEPPINNLLRLEIPIYVQVATNDESAPIESSYLIPLEFARLGKTNLVYKVCVGCDHGFNLKTEDGNIKRTWKEIFKEFIEWANKNDH